MHRLVEDLGAVGKLTTWVERQSKFSEGRFKNRILIRGIFASKDAQQLEDYGLVRENPRGLVVEDRREQRLKLCLGAEVMKKHPINIPFGT